MINNKDINKSIWIDTIDPISFPKLQENIKTEILIIGGGVCGILIAHRLKNQGHDVILVEAEKIGNKITKGTTAFVTAFHDVLYQNLLKNKGYKKSKLYLDANLEAINEYIKLSKKYDFHYENVDSCFFSTSNNKIIENEYRALKKLGYDSKLINEIKLPFDIKKGIVFPKQGQMNPLKLIIELAKELNIYENSRIININKNIAYTKKYQIEASKIIIATHFPIFNNILYSIKMYQTRSYVVAIKYEEDLKCNYTSTDNNGLYFRKYKDYLIIGGNDTKTGKQSDCYKKIIKFVKEKFKDKEIEYYWGNQDLITLDDIPYIGKINMFKSDIYVATGFNLYGMTTSMIASILISDLINKKKNKYSKLYKPSRNILTKQLFINMKDFIKYKIKKRTRTCTHLGCLLKYNLYEKSWDCPCHGSRFTDDGLILNDPAKKELE